MSKILQPSDFKLVILESPFAGRGETASQRSIDKAENLRYARACVRDCVLRGESPQASHLLFTQEGILDDHIPDERTLGINAGLAWRWVADYSVFYTDRGWSNGMLEALHLLLREINLSAVWHAEEVPLRIRSLHGPGQIPATLDEELEKTLKQCCEASRCP